MHDPMYMVLKLNVEMQYSGRSYYVAHTEHYEERSGSVVEC